MLTRHRWPELATDGLARGFAEVCCQRNLCDKPLSRHRRRGHARPSPHSFRRCRARRARSPNACPELLLLLWLLLFGPLLAVSRCVHE